MWGAARTWVYTHTVDGRWQRVHRVSGALLQAFFLVVPWLSWEGHALARVDLPARRITLFGTVFTASDTFFLFLMLILAAFGVFLVTAALGRAWCGWACPQTVFLEERIRPIEHLVEGERGARIRRDQGPWNWDRVWRKSTKWTLFAAAALVIGFSFASWFNDPRLLWSGVAGAGATGFAAALSGLLFLDFVWFREQFCSFLCPYARLQGALTDAQSVIVSYDTARGEPRGPRRKGADAAPHGACIDCNKCVAVCPAGIDIRQGYQLECIACARCIDACEGVMGKLSEPTLVRYTPDSPRLVRPRTLVYAGLLTLAVSAFVIAANRHRDVQLNVNRTPGTNFVVDADGFVRNSFVVLVANNDLTTPTRTFTVRALGLPADAQVVAPPVAVAAGADASVPMTVRLPPGQGVRSLAFTVEVSGGDEQHAATAPTTFSGDGS